MKNLLLSLSLILMLLGTTSLSGGTLMNTEFTKPLNQLELSKVECTVQQKIIFKNIGPSPVTLSIWYSDFNNVWTEVQRTHLPVGYSVEVVFDYGQLTYYGYSIDGGRTIESIYANYIEL